MAPRGPQEPQEELIMDDVRLVTNARGESTLRLTDALTVVLEAAYKNTGGSPGTAAAYAVVVKHRDYLMEVCFPEREENV